MPIRRQSLLSIKLLTAIALGMAAESNLCSAAVSPGTGAATRGIDRADLALRTDLWHSEFMRSEDDKDETKDAESQDPDLEGSLVNGTTVAALRSSLSLSVADAARDFFEDGMGPMMEETTDRSPAITESQLSLSEWDQAAVSAVAPSDRIIPSEGGPSAVTAVVAIVGAIVIVGAYLKG
jgi:hypothetical protein